MKRLALLFVHSVLFVAVAANACPVVNGYTCLFYGGDHDVNDPFSNGLNNETDLLVNGDPYGAATYQNFFYDGHTPITGLFTNNYIITNTVPKTGYWEIRSGISEGDGGTLVASGRGTLTNTPTGIFEYNYPIYTTSVTFSPMILPAGLYWFAVVPECSPTCGTDLSRSFNANTPGLNSIGTQINNLQFFNTPALGAYFTNANNEGYFRTFSSGVLTDVPEPSSMITLGSGLTAAGVVLRRLMR